MSTNKVSVIIPVYNVEKYIAECLESIINQSLTDIEIICVNDGSTDNSLDILLEYEGKDERIKVYTQDNQGQSAARNHGLKHATGEYIYFIDSDDFIDQNALKTLFDISKNNNLDVLYFGLKDYYVSSEMLCNDIKEDHYYDRKQVFDKPVSGEVMFNQFLIDNNFVCSVPLTFIRHEFIKNIGLTFEEGIVHEDELYSVLLIINAQRVMVIEDKFYTRRVRENSTMTTKFSNKNFIGYFIVYTTLSVLNICQNDMSADIKYALGIYTKKLYNTCRRVYNQLSADERKLVEANLPAKYQLFYQPIKEGNDILQSTAYKIGTKLVFIPTKVIATLKSFKTIGLKGTIQLIKKYYFK